MKQYKMPHDDAASVVAQINEADRFRLYYETDALFAPDDLDTEVALAIGNLPAARREALKRYAAAKRYAVETGGVAIDGKTFPSDRDSQGKFTSAAVMAQLNPDGSFNWKTGDGFVSLSAAQLIGVAKSVGAHVQACFDLEDVIGGSIESGAITSTDQIDAAPWPANG